jgi:molybdate transport system permease protein
MSFGLNPEEISALTLSIKVSICCVLISFIPGIVCGWLLARKNFPGKIVFDSLIHLPLVLPPVVIGYILLLTFGNQGFAGKLLNDWFAFSIAFSWRGAALASAIMGFPLLVRSVRISIEAIETRIEKAAATLGANPFRVFFTITVPLALPGIITGIILSFARSLGEFGATITFVSNIPEETQTLPVAIYTYTQVPGAENQVFRLALISIFISFAALLISEIINKRTKKILGK